MVFQNRTQYKKAFGKIRSLENYLKARQSEERSTYGRTHSDEEDEVDDIAVASSSAPKKSSAKSKSFLSKLRKVCVQFTFLYARL